MKPYKPTEEQLDFLAKKRDEGCIAGVCYSLAEAWDLIEPHLKPEHRIYTREALERWDMQE